MNDTKYTIEIEKLHNSFAITIKDPEYDTALHLFTTQSPKIVTKKCTVGEFAEAQ